MYYLWKNKFFLNIGLASNICKIVLNFFVTLCPPHLHSISNCVLSDDQIRQMSPVDYKALIKGKIRDWAFIQFKERQAGHKKEKLIEHNNLLKPQRYLTTNLLTNEQVSLLYNLRCESVWGIRNNFHRQYQDIKCQHCMTEIDSQSHILQCTVLKKHAGSMQSTDIH